MSYPARVEGLGKYNKILEFDTMEPEKVKVDLGVMEMKVELRIPQTSTTGA